MSMSKKILPLHKAALDHVNRRIMAFFRHLGMKRSDTTHFDFLPEPFDVLTKETYRAKSMDTKSLLDQRLVTPENFSKIESRWKQFKFGKEKEWFEQLQELKVDEGRVRYCKQLSGLAAGLAAYSKTLGGKSPDVEKMVDEKNVKRAVPVGKLKKELIPTKFDKVVKTMHGWLDKVLKPKKDDSQNESDEELTPPSPPEIKPGGGAGPSTSPEKAPVSAEIAKIETEPLNKVRVNMKVSIFGGNHIAYSKLLRAKKPQKLNFPFLPNIEEILQTIYDWNYETNKRVVTSRDLIWITVDWTRNHPNWVQALKLLESKPGALAYCGRLLDLLDEIYRLTTPPYLDFRKKTRRMVEEQNLTMLRTRDMALDMLQMDYQQIFFVLKEMCVPAGVIVRT